ncbi:MAG: FAD-dependent oxidoreductase [Candidatus Nanohaloarchaea archaeon]
MSREYDVIIAGAGPAGSEAARTVASRGWDVAVLESEGEAEFPAQSNKSTAGTFPRMTGDFYIPEDVVMNNTDSVVLESPDNHYTQEKTGSVLDFGDFKEYMAEQGQEKGAEYLFDSHVTGPITDEQGSIQGVQYNGDQEIYGDIVIDATGPSAPIAQDDEVGFIDLDPEKRAVGWEYLIDGVEPDAEGYADLTDAMMLRLDHDIAPGGYSWIFHTGEDTAKVGLCYIDNDAHHEYGGEDFNILDSLENWIVEDPRFPEVDDRDDIDPLEPHQGSAHIQMPENVSAEGVMGVGDTVSTIDPVWGEGIDVGMKSGKQAGITALEALGPKKSGGEADTSAEQMERYDRRWKEKVAPNRWRRDFMTHLMYNADNERYDQLMDDLGQMDGDSLRKLNQGSPRAMLDVLHLSDSSNVGQIAREKLGEHPAVRKAEEKVENWTDF